MELYYSVFNTAAGWIAVLASPEGLLENTLPQSSKEKALNLLNIAKYKAFLSPTPNRFADLAQRFRDYFEGKMISFPDILDITSATSFQRDVWQAARMISYGETRSYSSVAREINKPRAARAVGQALGKNPLPIIIPCHRVIGSNGKLTGFSGGMEVKKRLLSIEGVSNLY
jgi:methylated-DNA-[protein]-cysteine S-methyltransferase